MADARNGDVDAMDHHQEPARHLSGQRAALMRLELKRLSTPHPDCRTITDGFPGHPHAEAGHVRCGAHCGIETDIGLYPKCAMNRHRPMQSCSDEKAARRRLFVFPRMREPRPLGYSYSSLRSNFLCGFQICKPCRSTT